MTTTLRVAIAASAASIFLICLSTSAAAQEALVGETEPDTQGRSNTQRNVIGSECLEQTPSRNDPAVTPGTPLGEETGAKPITDSRSGTAMIGLVNCWSADTNNASYRALTDLYAHWTLERVDTTTAIRRYRLEDKPAILRLLVGRDRSFISSIRIDMHDPDQTATIPLVAFGYQGKVGKGQSWTTDVINDDQSQPYFRIGPSTSATITVSAKSADDVEVRTTGVILNTLRSISAIVTPGGSLLTILNREPLNQASTAVDNALSDIWSKVKDERQISGRQLSEWYEGAGFLIEVDIPDYVKTERPKDAQETKGPLGAKPEAITKRVYWLRLSCPRYSIFDPALACNNNRTTARPTQPDQAAGVTSRYFTTIAGPMSKRVTIQQILNFPLAQGKTLSQFLSDHAWYTQFLRMGDPAKPATDSSVPTPANTKEQSRTDNDYAGLCSQIVDALYGVGLSSFDARIGLWATITGSADFVGIRSYFSGIPQCTELLPEGANGTRWKYPAKEKSK